MTKLYHKTQTHPIDREVLHERLNKKEAAHECAASFGEGQKNYQRIGMEYR